MYLYTLYTNICIYVCMHACGAWWLIGRFITFRPKGHGFESCSRGHIGTLGMSFTHNCLWCFSVKHWHSIHAVSGAPQSTVVVDLKRRYRNSLNEWINECMHACTVANMYIYACLLVCMYACIHSCLPVCTCIYVSMHVSGHLSTQFE